MGVDAEVETTVAPDVEWNSKLKKLGDDIDETKFEIAQTHKECRYDYDLPAVSVAQMGGFLVPPLLLIISS